jgi:hypothetical protein
MRPRRKTLPRASSRLAFRAEAAVPSPMFASHEPPPPDGLFVESSHDSPALENRKDFVGKVIV